MSKLTDVLESIPDSSLKTIIEELKVLKETGILTYGVTRTNVFHIQNDCGMEYSDAYQCLREYVLFTCAVKWTEMQK